MEKTKKETKTACGNGCAENGSAGGHTLSHDSIGEKATHDLRVERARKAVLDDEMTEETCNIFKMLAEPSRLKIVLALLEGEMCVYHIVEAVGGKQSAVSHQLRILKDGKVIKARRNGQNVVYSIADEHIAEMVAIGVEHARCEVEQ